MRRPEAASVWFGTGDTLRLAVPLMAAQVAVVALGLVDTITFGRLGMGALAGGGLGTAVFSLVHIMCVGVLAAVGNEVAFARGAQDPAGIRRAVRSGMIVALGLGLLAGGLTAFSAPLLLVLDQSPGAVAHASHYLRLAALGIVPSLIFTCLRGLTVGLAKPGPITAITVAAVAIKALLNAVVVGVALDLPPDRRTDFGLAWCGFASTLTYLFMAGALWLSCRRRLAEYLTWLGHGGRLFRDAGELLRLGIPIGITYGVEAGLFTGVALIIGRFGEVALAAHQIANQCVYIAFMLAVGLSYAASVRAGQAAGSGNLAEARRLSRQAIMIGLVMMTGTACLFMVFGASLAAALVGPGVAERDDIVALAAGFLSVAAFFQWADGTQNIAMGALRGLKHARSTMVAGTLGYWVVGLPAAWLLGGATLWGPIGAWCGLGLGLYATAAMLVARLEMVTLPTAATPRTITA
ncbi:MATE family efflux transporter [Microvirga pudoricolor]|uniref:MATE family efflux transporter n=1 Tax=Microvirga pudoricolor TaxID=2778729 RepID=UPI0019526141|nr:MATE family efflux transporter [Microvirga pudoricolor]MBM6593663.1 MATE family efflux transporter [Microvirga pudoricolor]